MKKLLTIAIPTYNRAELLDKQLAWLSKAIQGFENECEILISDNCSLDQTQEIIQKWQQEFKSTKFINHRNQQNIGVMKNLVYCLKSAQTKFVWAIGDDDPIEDEAINYVISRLKQFTDISLFILNFSLYDIPSDRILYQTTFDISQELLPDGKKFIEDYLKTEHRGLGFLSAQIYRTSSIQQALKSWVGSVDNLEGQVYWGAFCATVGKVMISQKNYLQNARIPYKPRVRVKMHFVDLPQVFMKLISIGYCPETFRQRIINHFEGNGLTQLLQPILRRYPHFTVEYILPSLVLFASYIVPLKKSL